MSTPHWTSESVKHCGRKLSTELGMSGAEVGNCRNPVHRMDAAHNAMAARLIDWITALETLELRPAGARDT